MKGRDWGRLNDSTEELVSLLKRVRPEGTIARMVRRELQFREMERQEELRNKGYNK